MLMFKGLWEEFSDFFAGWSMQFRNSFMYGVFLNPQNSESNDSQD